MIIAVHLHPHITDTGMSADSDHGEEFAIVEESKAAGSLNIDVSNKKDIARSLIADNIDVLITHDISLEAFVLLKSYGVRVYAARAEPMSLTSVLEQFEEGALTEITPDNYAAVCNDPDFYKNNTVIIAR